MRNMTISEIVEVCARELTSAFLEADGKLSDTEDKLISDLVTSLYEMRDMSYQMKEFECVKKGYEKMMK